MAKSKDDIKYGSSQARLSEDEAVRVAYKHGTPLEGGKIAESETIDVFSSAHNVAKGQNTDFSENQSHQKQQQKQKGHNNVNTEADFSTGSPCLPKNGPPPSMGHKY